MAEKKKTIDLTIVLYKTSVSDYDDTYEKSSSVKIVNIKDTWGFDGRIVYSDSKQALPQWKELIDELSESKIDLSPNVSNRAALIVKIKDRFMAVVFGYGKSLLREEKFERNFGLKAALNMIAPDQMRSVQSAAIEDMVVSTHKQASRRTSQEEFDLNAFSDILRGVTGKPISDNYGNTISGKDTLCVSVPMDIDELGEKLELYLEAYQGTRYKEIGFSWIDNINEIRDPEVKDRLKAVLCQALLKKEIQDLYIAPPDLIEPESIKGFCFTGIGKKQDDANNYLFDPDIAEYVEKLTEKTEKQIIDKLRNDKLLAIDLNDNVLTICNIYSAIVWQCTFQDKTYILWNGAWYLVEDSFVQEVSSFIKKIETNHLSLPQCNSNESEGAYNQRVASNNTDYCLMDKKLARVKDGPKQIESCDLFTKDKQLIHVKKRDSSSQLSHLFSQGRVAAECFLSDEYFRKQVYELAKKKLGKDIFNYKEKPMSNEYEIIYAIIAAKRFLSIDKLPFFSQVNLMLTCQSLDRARFKYSVCFIERIE